MSSLSQLRDRLYPGAVLTCVRNTFRPERDGAIATVVAVSEPRRDRVICRGEDGSGMEIFLPTRRRDVEWLDEDTARWQLVLRGSVQLSGHSVTYRIDDAT